MASDPNESSDLPQERVQKWLAPFQRFLHVAAAGGVMLLLATIVSLGLANSPWSESFIGFWKTKVGFKLGDFEMIHSLKHWISDGLLAIFFFVMGLEVKRELLLGELRDMRRAALPIAAAIGGMVVPALLYIALQQGQPGARGWGIAMATDIAFVVGCLAVLGPRIPASLRILLVSLAIADDIGAILVIAFGYTDHINTNALLFAAAMIAVVIIFQRIGVRNILSYWIVGALVWVGFHESGIHATIAGVILGLMTPVRQYVAVGTFRRVLQRADDLVHGEGWAEASHRADKIRQMNRATRETISPLEYLEGMLHPWVAFVIMPVFALANAAVPIEVSAFTSPIAIAVIVGLAVGKPVGITLFGWLAVRLGIARLPEGVSWGVLFAGGALAGIGFTMSLFIAGLALEGDTLVGAKVGILAASFLSAVVGVVLLVVQLPKPSSET